MEHTPDTSLAQTSWLNSRIHEELKQGDWEGLYKSSAEWLTTSPDQPPATFLQNISCLFINPPAIIRNKRYLDSVGNKDWKAVLAWFQGFQAEADQHNPYFQAIDFILQPASKKKDSIAQALQENPENAELLFLQAISLRDHSSSIEKLKLAAAKKPGFAACLYLLGIFSLELNQVEAAEAYLKQAIDLAPDFLEAHYQLGSLYALYIPNSTEQSVNHFQRVIELDPDGGAGKDARRVIDTHSQPQYGQRIGGGAGRKGGGLSLLAILMISVLTALLFSGPIASFLKINTPLLGLMAGLFVFIGLYSAMGRGK